MGRHVLIWSVAQADPDGVRTARVGERKIERVIIPPGRDRKGDKTPVGPV